MESLVLGHVLLSPGCLELFPAVYSLVLNDLSIKGHPPLSSGVYNILTDLALGNISR